jgi:general secretion pathway protein D
MDSGDGGLSQNVVKFQPIGRLNSILVVSQKPEYLKRAGPGSRGSTNPTPKAST